MTLSIKDKVVVVTGASKGIGKGIAGVFARAGAKVMLVARGEDSGQATADELISKGYTAAFIKGDVSDRTSMDSMVQATVETFGSIDILCANAGIFPSAKIEDMTEDQWDNVCDVNLKGMLFSIQACLSYLKKSSQGRIILTSSITGPFTGYPGWSHYGATKAAMLGFMRTACIELARYGITMNAVLPGNIYTEGLGDLGEEYLATMAASIPMKRLGSVEDIGNGAQILPETLEAIDA